MERPPAQSSSDDSVSLQEILNPKSKVSSLSTFAHVLWLKRYTILICWMLLGVPSAVFLAFYDIPKTYWTSVNLRFPKIVGEERSMVQDISITELESVVALFNSYNVMSRTIKDLDLQFRISTKNVYKEYIFEKVRYGDEARYGSYLFKISSGRHLEVEFDQGDGSPKAKLFDGPVANDNVAQFGGLTAKFLPSVFQAGSIEVAAYLMPMSYAIKDLRQRVGVKALDKESPLKVNYTIFLEDSDPFMVADVLNDLVKNFIAVFNGTTEVQDVTVLEKMEKNLALARENEKKAQDALALFYSKYPSLQEAQPQGNAFALVTAQSEKAKQTEHLEDINLMVNRRIGLAGDDQKKLWLMDAINLLQSQGVVQVQTLQARLRDLESQKALLLKDYSAAHPKVLELDSQVVALCGDADKLLAGAQAVLEKRIERSNKDIASSLPKNLPASMELEAKRLTMEKDNASRIVENLSTEYDKGKLSTGANLFKVTIVDSARPPEFIPTNLKRRLVFSFAAFLAGFFPCLIWFVAKQVFFSRVWNRDDAARKLKVKVLGSMSYSSSPQKQSEKRLERGEVEDRLLYTGEASTLIQIENYRSVRTEVENFFGFPHDAGHSALIITSTQPFEGKSLFSANLAVSFARKKRRTLLIDADFRHGRQEKIFKLENSLGLSDILEETGLSDESQRDLLFGTISPTIESNLFVLTKGNRQTGSVEAITQGKINAIIALLKTDFEIVIVDTPPVIVTSDAFNLMQVIPNVVFVIRSGLTPAADAEEALELIRNRNVKIGCIVNAVQDSPFIKNHYHKYGHYYIS